MGSPGNGARVLRAQRKTPGGNRGATPNGSTARAVQPPWLLAVDLRAGTQIYVASWLSRTGDDLVNWGIRGGTTFPQEVTAGQIVAYAERTNRKRQRGFTRSRR